MPNHLVKVMFVVALGIGLIIGATACLVFTWGHALTATIIVFVTMLAGLIGVICLEDAGY